MPYTITQNDGEATIAVTLPWSEISGPYETAVEAATKQTAKSASMKGFRKGHVPKDIAQGQVDRMQILSEVVDDKVRDEFAAGVKAESLKVAAAPQVSVKKMAEGNDIEIELRVPLVPEVTLPKNWKKIVATVNSENPDEDVTISDDDVTGELTRIAESRTESIVVERAAADGDQVKIDFDVLQDGVLIEGGSSKDYALIIGKGAFIPGFEEHVMGMKAGDEKSFDLAFPEKYHAEHLAGKDATFAVKLHAVEERKTPVVDDAFAAGLGGTFKTLDDLKKNIKDGMTAEKKQQAEEGRKSAYLEKLSDEVDVTIPAALIDDEVGRMSQEMEQQISQSGMTMDAYLEQMGQTKDDLRKMWEPQAVKRIKSALLLEKLGAEYEIEPSSEDVEVEMNKTLAMYQGMEDMEKKIDMKQLFEYTKGILRNNAVFEELVKL